MLALVVAASTADAVAARAEAPAASADAWRAGIVSVTVSATVRAVNHSPVAVGDALSTFEDTVGSVNVLTNDTDADSGTLAVTGKTNGSHGTVTCRSMGTCAYTPAASLHAPDSFTYTVGDGRGGTATGTVDVTVNNVDDRPVAVDDSLSTAFGTAKVLAVLGNDTDADGDLLTVKRKTDATHGTVVCTVGGSCTYAPAAGYSGPDSFDYTVNDGQRGTDVGTVSVTVAPTVAPQVAVAVSVVTSLLVQAIQLVVGPGRQV